MSTLNFPTPAANDQIYLAPNGVHYRYVLPPGLWTAAAVGTTPDTDTDDLVANVRKFGATGNGVTDDTAAIQAAINSVKTGGIVWFPAGTFLVTAPVATRVGIDEGAVFMLDITYSNIVFQGAGKGVAIIKPKSNKLEIFVQTGATNLRFEGITFDNSANGVLQGFTGVGTEMPNTGTAVLGNGTNAGISQYQGADLTVIDCAFNAFTYGINYRGNNLDNQELVGDLVVEGCWFDGCAQGVICNAPRTIRLTDCDAVNIIGSVIADTSVAPGHTIYVTDRSGAYPETITIANVSGTNNHETSLRVRKGKAVSVTNCPVYNGGRGHNFENCEALTVSNCAIHLKNIPTDAGQCGLFITDCGHYTISNCVLNLQGTSAYAMRISASISDKPWSNAKGVIENCSMFHDLAGPTSDNHPWIAVIDQVDLTLRNLTGFLTANVAQNRRFIELRTSTRCHVIRPSKRAAAVGNPVGSERLVTIEATSTDCTVDWSSSDVDLVSADNVTDLGVNSRVSQLDSATSGTWTPTLTFATPGDFAMTNITLQQGRWVKIGNFVWLICSLSFDANAYTTASGTMQISGIPFPARGSGGLRSTAALGTHTKLNISGNDVGVWLDAFGTACTFRQSVNNAAGSSLSIANLPPSTTGVGIWFNIMYEVTP